MSRITSGLALMVLSMLLAACSGAAGPMRSFTKGDEVAYYDFSSSDDFEQGAYPTASLLVRDGVYRVDVREGDNELWWGQWGEVYDNVVIDVDVELMSQRPENAFGIMCRVRGRVGQDIDVSDLQVPDTTPEATMMLTDEPTPETTATEAATAVADATSDAADTATAEADATSDATSDAADAATDATPESTADADADATPESTVEADADATPEATPLVEVVAGDEPEGTPDSTDEPRASAMETNNGDGYLFLIQGGGSYAIMRSEARSLTPLVNWTVSDRILAGPGDNRLRAVCVGDYLAFYINDALVAEVTDDTYTRGQVGLAASAANRLGLRVEFDNLTVSLAQPG